MIAADMRQALRRSLWSLIWRAAALAAAAAALLMCAAALFVWVSERLDATAACLAVGSLFAVIALAAGLTVMLCRKPPAAETAAAHANATAWLEPSIVAAGLDIIRTIGGRRATTLAVGAVAAIWLLGRIPEHIAAATRTASPGETDRNQSRARALWKGEPMERPMPRHRTSTSPSAQVKQIKNDLQNLRDDFKELAKQMEQLAHNTSGDAIDDVKGRVDSFVGTVDDLIASIGTRGRDAVGAVDEIRETVTQNIEDAVRDHPLTTVAVAIGVGFMLSSLRR